MKSVSIIATVFGMVGAVRAQTPCAAKYIVDATYDGTVDMRRLSGAPRAGEDIETACIDTRKANLIDDVFPAQPASPATAVWMVKGGATMTEKMFTRMAVQVPITDTYWDQLDTSGAPTGTFIPAADRVMVIRTTEATPPFPTTWSGGSASCTGTTPCELCADAGTGVTNPGEWTAADLVAGYDGQAHSLVVIVPTGAKAAWDTYFGLGTPPPTSPTVDLPTLCTGTGGCRIAFIEDTGDVFVDVKTGLVELGMTACDVGTTTTSSTTTTTTTTTAKQTTTTTTTAEADSAGRVFAGAIPVAIASFLAFLI